MEATRHFAIRVSPGSHWISSRKRSFLKAFFKLGFEFSRGLKKLKTELFDDEVTPKCSSIFFPALF